MGVHPNTVPRPLGRSRARSGFDPSGFNAVHAGMLANARMPAVLVATHQFAWTAFRFGPKLGEAFADEQFPLEAVDEFYKQMIPDRSSRNSSRLVGMPR